MRLRHADEMALFKIRPLTAPNTPEFDRFLVLLSDPQTATTRPAPGEPDNSGVVLVESQHDKTAEELLEGVDSHWREHTEIVG